MSKKKSSKNDEDLMDIENVKSMGIIGRFSIEDKEKKQKKQRDFKTLGKKKVRKEISDRSKAINKIALAKKRKDYDIGIEDFIDKYGKFVPIQNPTQTQYQYFFQLFKASEKTKSISMFKQLCPKPFKIFGFYDLKLSFLSTDFLYWCFMTKPVIFNKEKNKFVQILSDTKLSNVCSLFKSTLTRVELASRTAFLIEDDLNIKEFYIQDSNVNYSIPNYPFEGLKVPEEYDVNFNPEKDLFFGMEDRIFIKSFIQYDGKDGIFLSRYNANNTKESIKTNFLQCMSSINIIKPDEKKLSKGIKETKYKKGVYYFQKAFTPTSFCPDTITGLKEMPYNIMVEADVEPSSLFDKWITDDNLNIDNFLNMDNLLSFFDFLNVLNAVSNKLNNFKNLVNALNIYNSEYGRDAIFKYSKLYKSFCKTCLFFYDSFERRASIERMDECKKKIRETMKIYENIENNEITTYNKIMEEIKNISILCKNFYELNFSEILSAIRACIDLIINDPDPSTISKLDLTIRTVGLKLYNLLLNGRKPTICAVRSSGSFLQNIIGDNEISKVDKNYKTLLREIAQQKAAIMNKSKEKQLNIRAGKKDVLVEILRPILSQTGDSKGILNNVDSYTVDDLLKLYKTKIKNVLKESKSAKDTKRMLSSKKNELQDEKEKNVELMKKLIDKEKDIKMDEDDDEFMSGEDDEEDEYILRNYTKSEVREYNKELGKQTAGGITEELENPYQKILDEYGYVWNSLGETEKTTFMNEFFNDKKFDNTDEQKIENFTKANTFGDALYNFNLPEDRELFFNHLYDYGVQKKMIEPKKVEKKEDKKVEKKEEKEKKNK